MDLEKVAKLEKLQRDIGDSALAVVSMIRKRELQPAEVPRLASLDIVSWMRLLHFLTPLEQKELFSSLLHQTLNTKGYEALYLGSVASLYIGEVLSSEEEKNKTREYLAELLESALKELNPVEALMWAILFCLAHHLCGQVVAGPLFRPIKRALQVFYLAKKREYGAEEEHEGKANAYAFLSFFELLDPKQEKEERVQAIQNLFHSLGPDQGKLPFDPLEEILPNELVEMHLVEMYLASEFLFPEDFEHLPEWDSPSLFPLCFFVVVFACKKEDWRWLSPAKKVISSLSSRNPLETLELVFALSRRLANLFEASPILEEVKQWILDLSKLVQQIWRMLPSPDREEIFIDALKNFSTPRSLPYPFFKPLQVACKLLADELID